MTRMHWDCTKQSCRLLERWDPGSLDGCLPREASFMDVDAMAEINGQFLFIEHESKDHVMGLGQRIALERLARQPNMHVWVIRDTSEGQFFFKNMKKPNNEPQLVTSEELRERVRAWGEWADQRERS